MQRMKQHHGGAIARKDCNCIYGPELGVPELDALPAAGSSDLAQTFGTAWSGPNLLLLDQRSGTLTSVNAPHNTADRRVEPLPVLNQAQLWSASTG